MVVCDSRSAEKEREAVSSVKSISWLVLESEMDQSATIRVFVAPVVMLTAKATRAAVLKGLAGGADGYITKPFEIDVLVKAVNVVLGLSEGEQTGDKNEDPWPT